MKLQHFVGVYVNMEAVNIAFPSGGNDGDYLIVDNEIKGWNPYSGQSGAWETPTVEEKAPVRKTDQVYGDLDVHHDLHVGGKLSAQLIRGKNAFLGLFDDDRELPEHPRVGEWAMVFAYYKQPDGTKSQDPTTRTADEICVGYIFTCEEDGDWKNTGYKGGYQGGLFEAIQTVQDNVDEEADARRNEDTRLNNAITAEERRAREAEESLGNAITTEQNRAEGIEGQLGSAIDTINSYLPSTVRSDNKLTDKAYVDEGDTRLNNAITTEQNRALAAEGTLQGNLSSLSSTVSQEAARTTDLAGRVSDIEDKIPEQADNINKLADKNFVNSSIATATATFRGTYNLVTDLELPVNATHAEIEARLARKIAIADNNDYVYVQVPNTAEKPDEILRVERYKFNGATWGFEYELNNSSFTAAQWAALNSGITSTIRETMQANIAANQAKIEALARGLEVSLFINPNVIYRNESQTITLSGVTGNSGSSSVEMILYDGGQELERSTGTLITKSLTLTLDAVSKRYNVVSIVDGMRLEGDATVNARYPIYYGFAASASALAASVLNRYAPTTSAAHTYSRENNADGQHFYILVPSGISELTSFTMNGAPFVMAASTEFINNITYKVYTSGNTYNAGTEVTVAAS